MTFYENSFERDKKIYRKNIRQVNISKLTKKKQKGIRILNKGIIKKK